MQNGTQSPPHPRHNLQHIVFVYNVFMPLISRVMYIQKYMAQSASLRGEAVLLLALEGGVGLDAVGRGALGRHQPLGPRALALSHPSSSTRQRTVEGDRSGEGRGEGANGQARAGIGTEGRRGERARCVQNSTYLQLEAPRLDGVVLVLAARPRWGQWGKREHEHTT